jgi:hypothetical protein
MGAGRGRIKHDAVGMEPVAGGDVGLHRQRVAEVVLGAGKLDRRAAADGVFGRTEHVPSRGG